MTPGTVDAFEYHIIQRVRSLHVERNRIYCRRWGIHVYQYDVLYERFPAGLAGIQCSPSMPETTA